MPARAPDLGEEIRALYHGPLGSFTPGRGALAKRLQRAGDGRAEEVRGLRKPSLSAWAVNQLFAREARAMAVLVGAGERARAAQRRVTGGGDPAPLRQAIEMIRAETERLASRGAELLAADERMPGEAILERLRQDLEALALDAAHAAVVARGWLDEDLERPGFEVMAALQLAAARAHPGVETRAGNSAPRGRRTTGAGGARVDVGTQPVAVSSPAMARQQVAAEERRQRIERASEELARAEERASVARRQAEATAESAAAARRLAAEAEQRVARAQREAAAASKEAATAAAAAVRAREAKQRLERS